MSDGIERLYKIAEVIRREEEPQQVTVREFLSWFRVQRRSWLNVISIRIALDAVGLRTEPDFQSAYIDSSISFVPLEGGAGAVDLVSEPEKIDEAEGEPSTEMCTPDEQGRVEYADPTYRISKLAAANKPEIFSVRPDSTLEEAVTLMLTNDFSQLPVMTSEREVKGIISWTSIGTRLALSKGGQYVKDLMDPHHEIRSTSSMFQAIPIIIQHQYVLVRGSDNRITGIVTASDLSLQFQQLAEPFLLLGEIENHIRRLLASKFTPNELAEAKDPSDSERKVNGVADLTFGEYIRILESPDRWTKVALPIDRKTFVKQIDRIRYIRNDVMHFDPDPMPHNDLCFLRDLVEFFQRLQQIGVI